MECWAAAVVLAVLSWQDLKSKHDVCSVEDGERESSTDAGSPLEDLLRCFFGVGIDAAMSIIVLTNSLEYPKGIKTSMAVPYPLHELPKLCFLFSPPAPRDGDDKAIPFATNLRSVFLRLFDADE